jgi:hypothetical protein
MERPKRLYYPLPWVLDDLKKRLSVSNDSGRIRWHIVNVGPNSIIRKFKVIEFSNLTNQ